MAKHRKATVSSSHVSRKLMLIPLAIVTVFSLVAGVRWVRDSYARARAEENYRLYKSAMSDYEPSVWFTSWLNTGPSTIRQKTNIYLSAGNIESLTGMSFMPLSTYSEERGGLLLINPPSETKYGDAGKDGIFEADDPWCVTEDGTVVTVGDIGASFVLRHAGVSVEGSYVNYHVTLSNFKIRVNKGAALMSSKEAAALGTGFEFGKDGLVTGIKNTAIRNTAPNAAGKTNHRTLAEGQYISVFGNLLFADSFERGVYAYARPLLLNQAYLGTGEDGSKGWLAWDCSKDLDENGQMTSSEGRKDTKLYNAASSRENDAQTAGVKSGNAIDYKNVVAVSFDVDVQVTVEKSDESESAYEGKLLTGFRGIDEPDRSSGSDDYSGDFVEAVTWRHGLTNSSFIMLKRTWGTYAHTPLSGEADFSSITRPERKTPLVDLGQLYFSEGKRFAANHLAGNYETVDLGDPESVKRYDIQDEAAGHATVVQTQSFGYTWSGSGSQTKLFDRVRKPRRITIESVGPHADKAIVADTQLAGNDDVLVDDLTATPIGLQADGSVKVGPVEYLVPWHSPKTLVVSAQEGYHVVSVSVTPEQMSQVEDGLDDETSEMTSEMATEATAEMATEATAEMATETPEEENAAQAAQGVQKEETLLQKLGLAPRNIVPSQEEVVVEEEGYEYSGRVDVTSMQVGDVRFLSGQGLAHVMKADDGSVVVRLGRNVGHDDTTGELTVGLADNTIVRVEVAPD